MKLLEYFIWFHSTQIPLLYTPVLQIFYSQVNVTMVVVWCADIKLSIKFCATDHTCPFKFKILDDMSFRIKTFL